MEKIFKYLEKHKEVIHAELFVRVWMLAEKIRFHPLNSKARGKTMQIVLNWLFDASSWLTLADLNILYSLLARTGTTKPTSVSATEISELSSRLCGIDMAQHSATSPSLNFKHVEQFISTLYSGDYPHVSLTQKELQDWLQDSGDMDSCT